MKKKKSREIEGIAQLNLQPQVQHADCWTTVLPILLTIQLDCCLYYASTPSVVKLQISSVFFHVFFSVPRPNMDKYVFLKVLENQEQVMIDPEYVLLICIQVSPCF